MLIRDICTYNYTQLRLYVITYIILHNFLKLYTERINIITLSFSHEFFLILLFSSSAEIVNKTVYLVKAHGKFLEEHGKFFNSSFKFQFLKYSSTREMKG